MDTNKIKRLSTCLESLRSTHFLTQNGLMGLNTMIDTYSIQSYPQLERELNAAIKPILEKYATECEELIKKEVVKQ